jgi:hypothetical protein
VCQIPAEKLPNLYTINEMHIVTLFFSGLAAYGFYASALPIEP